MRLPLTCLKSGSHAENAKDAENGKGEKAFRAKLAKHAKATPKALTGIRFSFAALACLA